MKITLGKPGPEGVAPNVVDRKFNPTGPGKILAGDITYLWAGGRWVYLAVVLDLFNREVLGWKLSEHVDEALAVDALRQAVGNTRLDRGWLMHTDQGATYTAQRHVGAVKALGGVPSMSRRGNCWDNSCVESFFGTLKTELGVSSWKTFHELELDLFVYIDGFYNRTRLHSTLGYLSPQQRLEQFRAAQKNLVVA